VSRLVNPDSIEPGQCEVIGVAELHGHLYVLLCKSKSIRVSMAEDPYSILRDVPLDGVIEPTDLAASVFGSCLYVTDVGEVGCVWRVQMEERVAESRLECVELKLAENEATSADSACGVSELTQRSDDCFDGETEQMETVVEDDEVQASAAEPASVMNFAEEQQDARRSREREVFKAEDQASECQEPISVDLQQCGREVGVDLREFIRMINGGQVVENATTDHGKSKSSPVKETKTKQEDAGEMIRSLLERTGLMKKISERGNADGPCVFEISRHYTVRRFVSVCSLLCICYFF